jgi:prevent-host-death family protein
MDQYLNVTEVRRRLLDLIEGLKGGDRVVITKHGRPRAVLIDSERLALLEDVAWVLQDPGRRAAVQRSWDELRRAEVMRPTKRAAPSVTTLRKLRRRRRRGK